jgi:hypothetical protein
MLGLGLGLTKLSAVTDVAKKLISDYIKRVTAAGGYLEGNECAIAKAKALNSQGLLDDASWLLIPEGIKEDVVYAQKPTSGLGDLVFTRASDATRTNSAGVIERTPWNLVTFSEQFNNAAWVKYLGSQIDANVATSPDGTSSADRVRRTITGIQGIYQNVNYTATGNYTESIFAKADTSNFIQISDGSIPQLAVNLTNGVITANAGFFTNVSVQSYPNGWYRIIYTRNRTATGTAFSLFFWPSDISTLSFNTTSATCSCFTWGAQIVEGTDAKPYFATTNRQDVPRLDYSGGATCPRLLLEPQRTNLALQSENFSTTWATNNLSVTTNVVTSPDGILAADEIVSTTSSNANVGISQAITIVSGTTYSTSFYVKPNTQRYIFIGLTAVAAIQHYVTVVIDTDDFTVGQTVVGTTSGTLVSTNIEAASNGFYRVTLTASINRTDGRIRIGFANAKTGNFINTTGDVAVTGSLGNSLYLWGAQLEAGSFATSYIPTTTATVTRLADGALKTGISSLIGQQEGVVYWEGILPQESTIGPSGEASMFNTERQPSTRTALTLMHRANTGTVFARMFIGNGTFTPIITLSIGGFSSGTFVKIAFAYKSGDSALYINGIQRATSLVTYTSVTTMNDINFNDNLVVYGYPSQQSVAQALLFKTRLTNSQLAELTTL